MKYTIRKPNFVDWWQGLSPEEREQVREQCRLDKLEGIRLTTGCPLGSFDLVTMRLDTLYQLHCNPLKRPVGDILEKSDWGQAILDLIEAYDAWLD